MLRGLQSAWEAWGRRRSRPGRPHPPAAPAARLAGGALLADLVDRIDDAVAIVDTNLRVVYWNAAMERLTDVDRAGALGRGIHRLVPALDAIALPQHLRRALSGGVGFTAEVAPGVRVEARCVPLHDARGRAAGAAAFLADMTERQRRALFVGALEAIGRSLTSSLDLDEVLKTIVHKALEAMTADSALVASWDGQSSEFRVMRAAGWLSDRYGAAAIPVGGGPISRAVLEARPLATDNILADSRFWITPERRAEIEREGFKAVAAAPLVSKGKVHGALVVHAWTERHFGEEELRALALLAEHAAIAIDNARLYADATRRAERLRALAAVSQSITASLDVADVMDRIASAAAAMRPGALAAVHIYDAEREVLRFTGFSGPELRALPPERPAGAGLTGLVFAQRGPVLIAEPAAHPQALAPDWWAARPRATYYGVPILVGETFVGVLDYVAPEGAPDSEEQEALRLLAAQAGIAIRNAWLYQAERTQAERAGALAAINQRISSALDLDALLRMIAESAASLTGVQHALFWLADDDTRTLTARAGSHPSIAQDFPPVLDYQQGAAGWVARHRRPLVIDDVFGDPRILTYDWWRQRGLRSFAGYPVLAGDGLLAVLVLCHAEPIHFTAETREVVDMFIAQASVAIQNARLYASARDSLARLRETQAQLVQAAKMSALGQLVSGVAHELNNPLSVIIGYGQLLLGRDIPEPLRHPVELMVSQGDRMARIVRNLLYFARQHPAERVAIDLHQVIEQTLALRVSQLTLSGIVVERDFADGLPAITGDGAQLQQVFLNLLLNAEQAIGERPRGRIVFRTRVMEGGLGVRAEVIDNGPGIPPDVLPRVFEPFFTTKEVGTGTGLGLSVSYGIVEEHGGRLTAESAPGRTVFGLELPAGSPAPAAAPVPPAQPPFPANGRAALLVEDEPGVVDLVSMLLRTTGWRVDVASGGRAGLERVRRTRYDLVVSDVRMPDGGGEAFYRDVLATDPSLAARFVFITGDTANAQAWEFLQATQQPVLEKPFAPDSFLEVVRRVATALTASGSGA